MITLSTVSDQLDVKGGRLGILVNREVNVVKRDTQNGPSLVRVLNHTLYCLVESIAQLKLEMRFDRQCNRRDLVLEYLVAVWCKGVRWMVPLRGYCSFLMNALVLIS
jgi:hypothetical protein